ncbi:thioesterase II family protein [Paenibacillus dendritiformis]|uniref:thioesterase II family protein n=1 Tax=Paenibacillus dendritiformis TaxID=130049 RepID=UPI00387E0F2F
MKKTRLFCFPHAGASSMMYSSWQKELKDVAELHLIEMAGRGSRSEEAHYKNVESAVQDIFQVIRRYVGEQPYMIFGNSMGSLLAYELCCHIENAKLASPEQVFLSAKGAPQINQDEVSVHKLPDDLFKSKVISMGGIPQDLFANKEIGDLFWPILRADYKLVETYIWKKKRRLNTSASILYGEEDEITKEQLFAWQDNFVNTCEFIGFEGGHLFIQQQKDKVIQLIKRKIIQVANLRAGGDSIANY